MELVDVPTIGGKFTCFSSNGRAMSRIERFLLSDSLIEDWKVAGQVIGGREISDHAPIWIKNNKKDWGPKPFKFNNNWLNHNDFGKFVEEEWAKINVKGRGDFCLVEKLKILKGRLSWWNKVVYGWWDLNIDKASEELTFLDNEFVHFASKALEDVKEGLLRLKLRQMWLSEGDRNSRFFHDSLRNRKGRSTLFSISTRRGKLEEVTEIKDFISDHFKEFFKENEVCRPVPLDMGLGCISSMESVEMEGSFLESEVKEAIWSCDGNKSPGPDGLYKIIGKLLAARIKKVIGNLVSSNQTAFFPGRNMMDGVMIVKELLDWSKK
ncbi:uncharacterized protein LOC131651094 [Vicia villosa]|uniref:uncharacterized protein LOC131651094 n=1 Tax=Vicia villosa TaxID=3911 RepID=UPI00273B93BF|nr:uncharacterized protein LOC131651094 [Vicia villosa]